MTSIKFSVLLRVAIIFASSALAATQVSGKNIISGLQFSSMKTFIKTNGETLHLEEDLFEPGSILYSNNHTLMTTDGRTVHLVAGSGRGYAVGMAAQAKFNYITGFLQINSTHVLIVDSHNHCLRYLNRQTGQTSQFVGNCTSSGLKDGYYTDSYFFYPWSVIKVPNNLLTVIVTERGNMALRSITLNTGEVRTLIKSLPSAPYGAVFDSNKEDLLVTLMNSMGKFNTKTSAFTTLTSIKNTGGLDGDFTTASFGDLREIVPIDSDLFVVADPGSQKLRVVDLDKKTIHSICNGNPASVGGSIEVCSLKDPQSLLLTSDTLYIGEYNSIRIIQVKRVLPCHDVAVKLTADEQRKCIEIIPGHKMCYPPGVYYYEIADRNCTITINVTKETGKTKCTDDIFEQADEKTLKAEVSLLDGYEITLPIGKHLYRKKVADDITCEITVHVTDPRLKNRLDISAAYNLSCTQVNESKAIILSVAKMRYRQINLMTSGYCNRAAENDVMMSCTNDVLSVSWPTSCFFRSYTTKEQDKIVTAVHEYLKKNKGLLLELLIPINDPPIIEPVATGEGFPASVVLTPVCLGGLKFMNATQTCQ